MTAELRAGANLSLTRASPGLRRALLGLSWRLEATGATPLEVDAQVVLLGTDGRVADDRDLVFLSELAADPAAPGGVGGRSSALDLAGAPEVTDVEQVVVDLAAVPAAVDRILVTAAVYAAAARRQSFAQVHDAVVRVVDADSGAEVARHRLAASTGTETAMVFGELYRHGAEWKFRAVGQGYAGGLAAVARDVGVRV